MNTCFGEDLQGVIVVWTKDGVTTTFKSTEFDQAANYAVKRSASNDVYFGLGVLKEKPKSGRGKASDVIAVPGFWLDIDLPTDAHKSKDYPPDMETVNKILQTIPLKPTLVVWSGHGLHYYWLFRELWYFKDENERLYAAQRSKDFQSTLIQAAKELGYKLDNTSDLSRILRLPGTKNHKNQTVVDVEILEDHSDDVTFFYDPSDFEPYLSVQSPPIKHIKHKENDAQAVSKYPFWECSFLDWMRKNPDKQTYPFWLTAASTLAYFGENGREAFHELSQRYLYYSKNESDNMFDKMLKSSSEGIGPITYEKLAEYGYDIKDETKAASPAIYIEHLNQDRILYKMGISFKEETGKFLFNATIFSEYIQDLYQLLIHEGKMFYQYNRGVWCSLAEFKISRIIFDTIQDAKKNLYTSSMGEEAIKILKLSIPEASVMDTHKHLINVENGMLDICSTALIPHDPSYFSTVQIPFSYDPNAECPRFTQFVSEIMDGDPERIAVVQEFFGYLLTAETVIHKAFFLYGEGSNGKSILLDILTLLIGPENVSNLSLVDLDKPFSRSNLIGKTANIATENEITSKGFNSQYFKAIVSGDRVQVEKKYENSFSYSPICKLVFAVNNLPYSQDKSHGLYRRMLIIPFDKRFDGKHADKHLKDKLVTELPGILNWSLIGLKRLRKRDYEFTDSQVINNAITHYIQDQNPMLSYIREMIVKAGPNDRVSKAEVMQRYYTWCRNNGLGDVTKTSSQKFWNCFRSNCKELSLPFEQQASNGVRYLKKISLRNTDGQE